MTVAIAVIRPVPSLVVFWGTLDENISNFFLKKRSKNETETWIDKTQLKKDMDNFYKKKLKSKPREIIKIKI